MAGLWSWSIAMVWMFATSVFHPDEARAPNKRTLSMKKVLCGLLVLLVLVSSLIVFIPVYLIRPFAPQTASDLEVSYALRSMSPLLTLAALVLGLLCAYALWKSTASRLRRTGLAVAGVLLTALAILARQNHFEWMFRPLPQPGYVRSGKGKPRQGWRHGLESGTRR